jgi:predicted acetyltransferase
VSEPLIRRATTADRSTLERLWLMFHHDMSEFRGILPNPDGTFRNERLRAAFDNPGWVAYVLVLDDRPVGFALVRGLQSSTRVLSSYFVVRAVRRRGFGLRAARDVVAIHPGRWEVAFQDNNPTAVGFWRRVATEIAGEAWTEERRPVPGRPDLPPDVWISFRTEAPAR